MAEITFQIIKLFVPGIGKAVVNTPLVRTNKPEYYNLAGIQSYDWKQLKIIFDQKYPNGIAFNNANGYAIRAMMMRVLGSGTNKTSLNLNYNRLDDVYDLEKREIERLIGRRIAVIHGNAFNNIIVNNEEVVGYRKSDDGRIITYPDTAASFTLGLLGNRIQGLFLLPDELTETTIEYHNGRDAAVVYSDCEFTDLETNHHKAYLKGDDLILCAPDGEEFKSERYIVVIDTRNRITHIGLLDTPKTAVEDLFNYNRDNTEYVTPMAKLYGLN